MQEALALLVLGVVLIAATRRPARLPEAPAAVGGSVLLLAAGAVSPDHAWDALEELGPTAALLAGLLVLARGCGRAGLFDAAGARLRDPDPQRLLLKTGLLALLVTSVLSLDTTALLVTPVVLAAAVASQVRPAAPLHLTVHLANSASLLLPIANLTNLLAVRKLDLSLPRFAALMLLPWLVVVAITWLGVRRRFAEDLAEPGEATSEPPPALPRGPLLVVVATLLGFVVSSLAGIEPLWAALAGAAAISLTALRARTTTPRELARDLDPGFLLFVLGLAVVVRAAGDQGLTDLADHLLPGGSGLLALLGVAVVSALAANLLNNLPATLLLLPLTAASGAPGPVLAMLLGVNIGSNAAYAASLATLLWRRSLRDAGVVVDARRWAALSLTVVPAALAGATAALWLALQVV